MCDPSAWLGWILMALVFSLWWPGFLALARWAVFRLQIPLLLAAPIIWVGGEFVRAYFLSGFPWYYLAHSQFRHLYLIQIADFTGSLGISLLIAVFNAYVVDLLSLPLAPRDENRNASAPAPARQALPGHDSPGYDLLLRGDSGSRPPTFRDGPKLALLQSNIEQRHKHERRSPQDHRPASRGWSSKRSRTASGPT